jgi:glycosyltransferase 2 family protein
LKLIGRIALGVVLLAAVIWYADPAALARQLASVRPGWFAAGVLASIVSNLFSAARWAAIARGLGLHAPPGQCAAMYFRGMTMNVLLPGATVSGDLLRSYQLAQVAHNGLLPSGLSVLLDRLSGLWILCAMSLLALLLALSAALISFEKSTAIYVAGLALALLAPFVPLPVKTAEEKRRALLKARGPLLSSAWLSVLVQVFSAAALWLCAIAAGLQLPYFVMLAAAAPIFVMGALPLGWGGFGAREAAAVVVLGAVGAAAGQATAAALLYGLSAVLQGVLSAPLFLAAGDRRRS